MDAMHTPAGVAFDKQVAAEVMGIDLKEAQVSAVMANINGDMANGATGYTPPSYSTDIRDAWGLVGEMLERGFELNLWAKQDEAQATFTPKGAKEAPTTVIGGHGDPVPEAICKAALVAMHVG